MALGNSIFAASRALFMKRLGSSDADVAQIDRAFGNNTSMQWRNAADTANVDALNVDAGNTLQFGGQCFAPHRHTFTFKLAANGSLASQQFLIVPFDCRVVGITEVHSAAGDDAGAVTAYVEKLTGTTAVAAGTTLMSGTFNMKAAANTVQTATLVDGSVQPKGDGTSKVLDLAAGDRLAVVFSGTLTTLAGVVITISVTPGFKYATAFYSMNANGDIADQTFYVATRPVKVVGAYYAHAVKGTHASAVNVQVVKDTSTNAPGAGADLLTNNTNAGFNCKGANYTVQTAGLTATAANLRLAPGDRLSVDFAGVTTALAGVVLVVLMEPLYDRKEISWTLNKNGDLADQAFFIADRSYQIIDVAEVHATAGNDGSAVSLQLVIDKATDAPGAGVDMLSDNTNVGFNLKGAANTVQYGTLKTNRDAIMLAGDRLSLDFAGTLTTLAGVTVTVALKPI